MNLNFSSALLISFHYSSFIFIFLVHTLVHFVKLIFPSFSFYFFSVLRFSSLFMTCFHLPLILIMFSLTCNNSSHIYSLFQFYSLSIISIQFPFFLCLRFPLLVLSLHCLHSLISLHSVVAELFMPVLFSLRSL